MMDGEKKEDFFMGDWIRLEYREPQSSFIPTDYMLCQPDTHKLVLIGLKSGNRYKAPVDFDWRDNPVTKEYLLDLVNNYRQMDDSLVIVDIHLIKSGAHHGRNRKETRSE